LQLKRAFFSRFHGHPGKVPDIFRPSGVKTLLLLLRPLTLPEMLSGINFEKVSSSRTVFYGHE
jgi:hypothetical protein